MADERRTGSAVGAGCLVVVLAWVVLSVLPAVLLLWFGEFHREARTTEDASVLYRSVRAWDHDLAWVRFTWRQGEGETARPRVSMESAGFQWARAEGEIVSAEPDSPPVIGWKLSIGLFGSFGSEAGVEPMPVPGQADARAAGWVRQDGGHARPEDVEAEEQAPEDPQEAVEEPPADATHGQPAQSQPGPEA